MEKINFGIVGTGGIAHRFANAIKNVPEANLAAVASRTEENAEKFGNEFDIPHRFGSYKEMAASDVVDVAYIAVPHGYHKDCACLMMNGGKHVLCEKPMAVNAREAEEMLACAQKNNVFLMEAMWTRFLPGTAKLLKIIGSGELGKIKGADFKFCYCMDESMLGHHVFKNENGGGSLLDVGVYALNFASWIFGEDTEKISAFADIANGVDSHICILIKYKNGSIADISSAILLRKPNEAYIYGTKGYARLENFFAPTKIEISLNSGESEVINTPYFGDGFEYQISHVCSRISSGMCESPLMPHAHTYNILKQTDEVRKLIGISFPQDK